MRRLVLAALLAGCSTTPAPAVDAGPQYLPACTTPAPAFRHAAFYETLKADARAFSVVDGDWLEDQGDATFYGLAFHARVAKDDPRYAAAKARSTSAGSCSLRNASTSVLFRRKSR